MKPVNAKRERGAALLALLAVIMLGASWFLINQLNAESGGAAAIRKSRNAEVLNRAKQALIGYVAAQAIKAGENNPGALPCPENPGDFDSTTGRQGVVGTSCGTTTVGRLPWRTLGLDQLVDASGEPLWYVVSTGWGVASGSNTNINSNSVGQLTVDGAANAAVALIIAPGPAFSVAAATGCSAFGQVRPTAGSPDWRNYLECENATYPTPDANFVTTGPSASFNDQVVQITVADIMPAIEAAIAKRIESEILPALQTVYTHTTWGVTTTTPGGVFITPGVTPNNPVLPFAAPFASPGPGSGTSNYQGANVKYAGLLPFNQTENCTVSASDPRCTTALSFLAFAKGGADVQTSGSGSIRTQSGCSPQGDYFVCLGEYLQPSIAVTVQVKISNVAMGLRKRKTNPFVWQVTFEAMNDTTGGSGTQTISHTVTENGLQADGSWLLTIAGALLPDIATEGWGTYANYRVTVKQSDIGDKFGDHALLSSIDGDTGWFVRNEWYRLLYYVVSQGNTAAQLPSERSCTSAANCLTVANMTPSTSKSAALILAGRSINGSVRPSTTLADYLEYGNANGIYESLKVTPSTAVSYADTGTANAYSVSVSSLVAGNSFQFKAANTNTGGSTLTTSATGTRSLVNADASALTASTIQANALVQVVFDGTQFLLLKRPFNDRVAAVNSN